MAEVLLVVGLLFICLAAPFWGADSREGAGGRRASRRNRRGDAWW